MHAYMLVSETSGRRQETSGRFARLKHLWRATDVGATAQAREPTMAASARPEKSLLLTKPSAGVSLRRWR
jgi:hypothetical protein